MQSNHEFLKVVKEACFSNSGGGGDGVSLCPNGQPSQMGKGAADPTTGQCINGTSTICFHGTAVAGVAAGNNSNPAGKNSNPGGGKPDNGVAKYAKIVAIQVFTRFNDARCRSFGRPPPCVLAYTSDLILALNWVFQNALTPAPHVKLASVNLSLAGGEVTSACDTDPLKPSIDNLRKAGVATAAASGNNGSTETISWPACISTAVAVGSSDKQDVISGFSNMASLVKLMAPGGLGEGNCAAFGANNNPDIFTSFSGTSPAVSPYGCIAGTSFATPHVAGAFAALRTACPKATVGQILTALKKTGKPIRDTRRFGTQTKPRIQVDLALKRISTVCPKATVDQILTAQEKTGKPIEVTRPGGL